jgi:hypothetical protein
MFFFQLLEGVGAISGAEGRKAGSRNGCYQSIVTDPLNSDSVENTATLGPYDEDGQDNDSIFSGVEKACTNF